MAYNLIVDHWLPVRRENGAVDWVKPSDLAAVTGESPVVALNFPRPDFNAAVLEFLIGLFTVALPPKDEDEWHERWDTPPSQDELDTVLKPFVPAFDLDGDGPRAFQDLDPLDQKDANPINAMLIDAPGVQTKKQNADFFIKHVGDTALSVPIAAAALITLQTYAPSGGAGHRTSLRGGGPLTTLAMPQEAKSLWQMIWANVPDLKPLSDLDGWSYPLNHKRLFPWLSPTRESTGDKGTVPNDVHPLQSFFGLPRRIRLEFSDANGELCGLGGPSGPLVVRRFRMRPYGVKYTGAWRHPLTPYRIEKKSAQKLPLHPNPGSLSYRHWLGLIGLNDSGAEVEAAMSVTLGKKRFSENRPRIAAFGFDMDNMKARSWADQAMPMYGAGQKRAKELSDLAKSAIKKSEAASDCLTRAIKIARFGKRTSSQDKSSHVNYTTPRDLKGDFSFIGEQFWRETEPDFRAIMDRAMANTEFSQAVLLKCWVVTITHAALRIFDTLVDFQSPEQSDMARPVIARRSLVFGLRDKVSDEPRQPQTKSKN